MSTDQPIQVAPSRFVTIELAALMTGLSESAIRTKISRGVWMEDREYVRAPDSRVLIDMRGYERWERGAMLDVNCKDGTQISVRLPKKG